MPLFETSAKDDDKAYHVEAIFVTLAHKIKKQKTMLNGSDKMSRAGRLKAAIVMDHDEIKSDSCFWC